MSSREYLLQDKIAVAAGVVKFAARLLVVAVVGKNARFSIQCVRPVGIVRAGGKHKHLELARDLASVSETTLTIYAQQLWQRIVSGVAAPPSLVECIYMKVRSSELVKGDGSHNGSMQEGDLAHYSIEETRP